MIDPSEALRAEGYVVGDEADTCPTCHGPRVSFCLLGRFCEAGHTWVVVSAATNGRAEAVGVPTAATMDCRP